MESKYINQLLENHDCVIIPNFGGFISNYAPAKHNIQQDFFSPPHKAILFNPRLTQNDGVLASYIVLQKSISYQEALREIDLFVADWLNQLSQNNSIEISMVGKIFYDQNKKLLFQQYHNINWLQESYGLNTFHFASTKKRSQYQKTYKTHTISPKEHTKKLSALKWAAVFLPIIALSSFILLQPMSLNKYQHYYSAFLQPTYKEFQSITQDFPEENAEIALATAPAAREHIASIPSASTSLLDYTIEKIDKELSTITVNKNLSEDVIKTTYPISTATSYTGRYCIIAGSFTGVESSQKHIQKLASLGYEPFLIEKEDGNNYRIAIMAYDNKAYALEILDSIKTTNISDAWLLYRQLP